MKILIVDDDELLLDLLEHALTRDGYEVLRVQNGREALEVLAERSCRLVISDWEMPEMSGIDLCRSIRGRDFGGYVYVILLTSHSGTTNLVEGMSAGADDFISKPFHAAELSVRVRAGRRVVALETREMAIFALAKLAESRDPETGRHLERVQRYSRLLAERLAIDSKYASQVDAEFIQLIYLASTLHDIGKVGIPDSVLLKAGRLNNEEYEIMKTHAALGAQTLSAAVERYPDARFLEIARDIAAAHHERWDGTGYPAGLAGEAIPLSARIVALADVYDALTSKRTYKEAFKHTVARGILIEGSGTHFDPTIVDAFLQIQNDFIAVYEEFSAESEVLQAAST